MVNVLNKMVIKNTKYLVRQLKQYELSEKQPSCKVTTHEFVCNLITKKTICCIEEKDITGALLKPT